MKKYLRNLWLALIGSPAYSPARHNTERVTIEADTFEACLAIDTLRRKVEQLTEALNLARSMAEEVAEFNERMHIK
jgi:hypothetical protein